MAPLLNVSNLSVVFQSDGASVHAVNGFNLSLEMGKAVAIVGESGSGKSTVMMAVMRLLAENAVVRGQVMFDGKDLLALPEKSMRRLRGREIAMIFQNAAASMNPTKTIGDQIIEPMLYHHMASASQARRKAVELLRQVGIPDPEARLNNYPFELSGGQLQRVMIAMALMADPKLLIADEPTTALDVTVQAEVLILLKKLQRELGMSLVFVTHDLAVAAQLADEIYVMYGGMVMEHLLSKDLMTTHVHPYLHGLLQSIPRLDGPREMLPFIPGQPILTTNGLPEGCVFADRCVRKFEACSKQPSLVQIRENHHVACWLADTYEEREALRR
ncbi:MAG: ABC transporter ATP-binding protein [Alicyclobacillus sp.]|nr:ABC transporter ATP-binding protein [Alicyclobacillus sp.]